MNIRRNQSYTSVRLENLKYGEVFEYNDEVFIYINPSLVKRDCSDTTPVLSDNGNIYYLCKSTDVIHYPNAELYLGNAYAFKG